VAAGKHAAVLHFPTGETHDQGVTPIEADTFILVDAAPQWLGYASDLTRTYAYSTTTEMRNIHEIVEKAQLVGLNQHVIGNTWQNLVNSVKTELVIGLEQTGIVRGELGKLLDSKVVDAFMPHGVGHPIGLDVHDPVPQIYFTSLTSLTSDFALAPGHVNTVEPGIYFIPYLLDQHRYNASSPWHEIIQWDVVDAYMHVGGVRIEDVVAIDHAGTTSILTY
jgi:Xaa-Pro aminopeptidase